MNRKTKIRTQIWEIQNTGELKSVAGGPKGRAWGGGSVGGGMYTGTGTCTGELTYSGDAAMDEITDIA